MSLTQLGSQLSFFFFRKHKSFFECTLYFLANLFMLFKNIQEGKLSDNLCIVGITTLWSIVCLFLPLGDWSFDRTFK